MPATPVPTPHPTTTVPEGVSGGKGAPPPPPEFQQVIRTPKSHLSSQALLTQPGSRAPRMWPPQPQPSLASTSEEPW